MSRNLWRHAGAASVLFAGLAGACGSDGGAGSGPGAKDGGTVPDGGSDSGPAGDGGRLSCANPGDVGNSVGIGTYCSPGGGECTGFSLAPLCLADAAPTDGQWFCTRLCRANADCKEDAFCLFTDRGSACVPTRCRPPDYVDPTADAGPRDGGGPG